MKTTSSILTDAAERDLLARRENRISIPLRWPRRPFGDEDRATAAKRSGRR